MGKERSQDIYGPPFWSVQGQNQMVENLGSVWHKVPFFFFFKFYVLDPFLLALEIS